MKARTVKTQHSTFRDDIADLVTRRALPTPSVNHLDPFLFLNHHGPQTYRQNNQGLPFGPHPHRGFETVTFILEGDLKHQDTGGHESVINAGGVQWMTAGRGLIHSEVSSEKFMREGGPLEILQLWLNLPARLKMTQPAYVGLQRESIPAIKEDNDQVTVNLLAGTWGTQKGPFKPLIDIDLMSIEFKPRGKVTLRAPLERNVFFYVVKGELKVNSQMTSAFHLVEFKSDGEEIHVEAMKDSIILFGHARPFREPIVAHGPFVMNSKQEILEAIQDYQTGKFN